MATLYRDKVWRDFRSAVNMNAAELAGWLETGESHRVGRQAPGATESVGTADRRDPRQDAGGADGDYAYMRKVVGYVRRHLARRPVNDVTSRWRYSPMNWGHDPIA